MPPLLRNSFLTKETTMTLNEAVKILKPTSRGVEKPENFFQYVNGENGCVLNGQFDADYLEAMAVYMRHKERAS
jgi:hypothetical protein